MITREGAHLGRVPEVGVCDRQFLLAQDNAIAQPSAFFVRAVYAAAGKLDHTLYWALDYDLWLRLTDRGTLVYVPQTWSQTRLYAEAKTSQRSPAMFDEIRAVAERHGGHGLPAKMAVVLESTLMPGAIRAFRAGDLSSGRAQRRQNLRGRTDRPQGRIHWGARAAEESPRGAHQGDRNHPARQPPRPQPGGIGRLASGIRGGQIRKINFLNDEPFVPRHTPNRWWGLGGRGSLRTGLGSG